MNHLSPNPKLVFFTCFVFIFLLFANAYAFDDARESEAKVLLQQGEALYKNEQFNAALDIFKKAVSIARDTQMQAVMYLNISLTYYKLGNSQKSEENLRLMFELDSDIKVDDSRFEEGYAMVYKKIEAEYWFSVKSEIKLDKEEDRRIIAQMSERPEKKKSKLLPLLIIGGVLIAAVVMAITLWNDGGTGNKGTLKVTNSTDFFVEITIGTVNRPIGEFSTILIYLEPGNYTAVFTAQNNSRSYPVTIKANQTSVLIFSGWED